MQEICKDNAIIFALNNLFSINRTEEKKKVVFFYLENTVIISSVLFLFNIFEFSSILITPSPKEFFQCIYFLSLWGARLLTTNNLSFCLSETVSILFFLISQILLHPEILKLAYNSQFSCLSFLLPLIFYIQFWTCNLYVQLYIQFLLELCPLSPFLDIFIPLYVLCLCLWLLL